MLIDTSNNINMYNKTTHYQLPNLAVFCDEKFIL